MIFVPIVKNSVVIVEKSKIVDKLYKIIIKSKYNTLKKYKRYLKIIGGTKTMIVDGKGKIFEDRRKNDNRRKNEFDNEGGRRKEDRRKEENNQKKKK